MGLLETTIEITKVAGQIANPELVNEARNANSEALAMSRENLELHKKVQELQNQVQELQAQRDRGEAVVIFLRLSLGYFRY
jgi:peptidoglycan hydrolase CwlO-like protein